MDMSIVPAEIIHILRTLERSGYTAYLAGGCVRDMAMGRRIHDWDIASSAPAEAVSNLFQKTADTGIKYGTVTVFSGGEKAEVTTFRRDGIYSDGRRPESVSFVSGIEEDLKRRDFTINAMALSADGELIDLHGGMADIKSRLIQCVGAPEKRFSEDALRMFRALRFAAQLGFTLSPETVSAISARAVQAHKLSGERVFSETDKILTSDRPEIIASAISFGLYSEISGSVDKQMLLRIRELDCCQRWSGFCAILEKHEYDASAFLQSLRASKKLTSLCTAIPAFERERSFESKLCIKQLLAKYGPEKALCASGADFAVTGRKSVAVVQQILDSDECFSVGQLKINGNNLLSLGLASGKKTGELLRDILEHILENPEDNDKDTLIKLAKKMIDNY